MKPIKTLRIYFVGNWEPLKDFEAEDWQNEFLIFQLNSIELEGRREARQEAVAIGQETEDEGCHKASGVGGACTSKGSFENNR